jgi:hypothetical protein
VLQKQHEELVEEDVGILKNFNSVESEIDIDNDRESLMNDSTLEKKDKEVINLVKVKKVKKNEIIAKGRHGSLFVKIMHK